MKEFQYLHFRDTFENSNDISAALTHKFGVYGWEAISSTTVFDKDLQMFIVEVLFKKEIIS